MAEVLNREQIRERIGLLEALESVSASVEEVQEIDWKPGELMDLRIVDRSPSQLHVSSVRALPLPVVLAGLNAMRSELVRLSAIEYVQQEA